MPAPRFKHGFANDVFISYTHADDHEEAGIRWVSQFEIELRKRLAQVSGQSIATWRDDKLTGADRFGTEIEDQLTRSAVLVPIVSPSYFNSEPCERERAEFLSHALADRGLFVGNRARIVKAAKTRAPLARYPEELRELLEFRFYVEEQNGTAREFHLSADPRIQKMFFTVVDDTAQAIDTILRDLERGTTSAAKAVVYLGESSSDVDAHRGQLRRSLVHRGYAVLPEVQLRLRSGPEARHLVSRNLAQCVLAVYPVGGFYGPVLEGSGERSITELQLETAIRHEHERVMDRLVWVPHDIQVTEHRQQQFLDRVRTELPSKGFEVIESPLTEIETHIKDRLERPASLADTTIVQDNGSERFQIYLLCLPHDRDAARLVRDRLHSEGYEVRMPPTSDEGYAALHTRRLEAADAFVVFWGHSDEEWLDTVLTDLRRAKGLRKRKPALSQAIFLADPPTPEKRDFVTHQATLLVGFSPTAVEAALLPFFATLRRPESPS